jgi:hypothetical protein
MVETTMSHKKGWTRRHYTTELRNGPKHLFFLFFENWKCQTTKKQRFSKQTSKKTFVYNKMSGRGLTVQNIGVRIATVIN